MANIAVATPRSAMEQAPPPPPPATPSLFLTPQLAKKHDKTALILQSSSATSSMLMAGGISKRYQTKSTLLLQISVPINDKDRPTVEFQAVLDSINETLQDVVENGDQSADMAACTFDQSSCEWNIDMGSAVPNEAAEFYSLSVIIFVHEVHDVTNYIVDTRLKPREESEQPLPGFNEAKAIFDFLALQIRKSIVRLEFPEFPEGCKGRPFREIYQLNARVSGVKMDVQAISPGWLLSFCFVSPQLKSGSFATVCRGTHRATDRKVAIKCVLRKDLPAADDAAIYDEVAILSSLNHPHIVPIIDFFDEKDCYFIVMELMRGGDLFDRIGKKKTYSEADARDLIVKMLKAVAYCHSRKIAHCDMKPKNLLLMTDDNDSFIKLADFGFAARVHEPKSLVKQCGTPFFVSPEILLRKGYDQQSDMWSVGCIIYLLLSGNLPFMGRSQKELFRKIVAGKYEFDEREWAGISDDAKDLVQRCLVLDPDERITAAESVKHQWLRASRDRLSLISLQGTSQRLKTFNARMKLRAAMITVDWVSSLTRMTSFGSSMRNVPSGVAGPTGGSDSATSSSNGRPTNALLAAARQVRNNGGADSSDSSEEDQDPNASHTVMPNPLVAAAARVRREGSSGGSPPSRLLAATAAMKKLQVKGTKGDD
jgi:calcium/calmodulin-dependent protein kinase I